ncbi:MAG: tetratricopeptide repeat protein [Sphingobacteriales bacterium]|nr:MAG: tetratricopeptide repeat protein [Sphingobacteriales bacterium]
MRRFLLLTILCLTAVLSNHAYTQNKEEYTALLASFKKLEQSSDNKAAIRQLEQLKSRYPGAAVIGLQAAISTGNIYLQSGPYTQALNYYDKALAIARKGYPEYLALCCNKMGNAYNLSSNQDSAFRYYQLSVSYAQSYANKDFPVSYAYNNLATILSQQKQYDKALYYIEKGILDAHKNEDHLFLTTLLLNKGINLRFKGDHTGALQAMEQARQIGKRNGFTDKTFKTLLNIINLKTDLEQYAGALQAAREAEAMVLNANNLSQTDISYLYRQLAEISFKQKDYPQTRAHLEQSKKYSTGAPFDRNSILHQEAQLAYAEQHYQAAYDQLLNFYQVYDSLNSKETVLKVQELETKYRTLEKDKEISEQNAHILTQNQRLFQKNLWIVITVLSLLLLTGLFTWWRYKIKAALKLEKQHLEIERLQHIVQGEETERHRLAKELHDGINSQLAGAKSYLLVLNNHYPELKHNEHYQLVKEILNSASSELRSMAHNMAPGIINKGLVTAVKTYLDRTGVNVCRTEFQHYGDFNNMEAAQVKHMFRIIQELVQNALKHAHAKEIIILLNEYQEEYCIIVEDDGIGFLPAATEMAHGIGIQNIKDRVALLSGKVEIETALNKGCTFIIHVPKQSAIVAPGLNPVN